MPADTSKPPSRAALRKYLGEVLRNAADFDAFCLDHFPAVHQRFANDLDRVSRVNLLLELEQPRQILCCLRQFLPDRCDRYEHLLQETTPRQQKQQHLSEKLEQKYQEKQRLGQSGMDTTDVDEQILSLRRECRQGPQLVEGEILKGRYKLAQIVGYGGFATVWQAWDQERKEFVAIKVLHSQWSADQSRIERFSRGARCMFALAHPNIVRVLSEVLEDEGFYFFIMEYLGGGTLASAIRDRKISRQHGLRIILQTGEALTYAHERQLVHRDIKPHNIMLAADGSARLADFDLVLDGDSTGGTRTGAGMGTFIYAAPELLANAKDVDCRADVFSLGMSAAFVIAGTDLQRDALQDGDRFVSQLSCSKAVKQVLRRAIAWEQRRRYPTMAAFCAALREALVMEPVPSIVSAMPGRDDAVIEPPSPRALGRRVGLALGTMLPVALVTLGAIRYWHPQPRPPRPTADMAQVAHADLSSRARLDADVAVDAGNSRAVPGTGEPPTLSAPPPNEPADRASPRADAKVDAGPGGSAAVTPPTSLAGSPGDGRSREVPPQKAFSAKNQLARGLVPVRFVVEPAVVNATVVCKARRTSCKGSCSIGIPRGVSCQFTARGYHDKLVRFSDLRINQGSRFFRVVLSPFKL